MGVLQLVIRVTIVPCDTVAAKKCKVCESSITIAAGRKHCLLTLQPNSL